MKKYNSCIRSIFVSVFYRLIWKDPEFHLITKWRRLWTPEGEGFGFRNVALLAVQERWGGEGVAGRAKNMKILHKNADLW